jgi:hypothetical protein
LDEEALSITQCLECRCASSMWLGSVRTTGISLPLHDFQVTSHPFSHPQAPHLGAFEFCAFLSPRRRQEIAQHGRHRASLLQRVQQERRRPSAAPLWRRRLAPLGGLLRGPGRLGLRGLLEHVSTPSPSTKPGVRGASSTCPRPGSSSLRRSFARGLNRRGHGPRTGCRRRTWPSSSSRPRVERDQWDVLLVLPEGVLWEPCERIFERNDP